MNLRLLVSTTLTSLSLALSGCPESDDAAGGGDGGPNSSGSGKVPECDYNDRNFFRGGNDCEYTLFDADGSEIVSGTMCDLNATADDILGTLDGKEQRFASINFASGDNSEPTRPKFPAGMLQFKLIWTGDHVLTEFDGLVYGLDPADDPFVEWTFAHSPNVPLNFTQLAEGQIAASFGGSEDLQVRVDSVEPFCHQSKSGVDRTIYTVHGSAEATTTGKLYGAGGGTDFEEKTYSMKLTF
jgi:hypothetical protein